MHTQTHTWKHYRPPPRSTNGAIKRLHFYNGFIGVKSAHMWFRFCNASRLILSTVLRLHALKRNKQQEHPLSSSRQPFWNQTAISNRQPHYWTLRTAASVFSVFFFEDLLSVWAQRSRLSLLLSLHLCSCQEFISFSSSSSSSLCSSVAALGGFEASGQDCGLFASWCRPRICT